jgi:hypothetical protein
MNKFNKCNKIIKKLYKFIDFRQTEVKFAAITSLVLEIFFLVISFYSNFQLFENYLNGLFQCIIGGLISLLGLAVAGVAIVITLFTPQQIKILDKLKQGAFEVLLEDFRWFALTTIITISILLGIGFLIQLPYNLPHFILFYLIVFATVYLVFYLLFYGSALIRNCIMLSRLKCTIDEISSEQKTKFEIVNEMVLDFLVNEYCANNKLDKNNFYLKLSTIICQSNIKDKEEIIQYYNDRYIK